MRILFKKYVLKNIIYWISATKSTNEARIINKSKHKLCSSSKQRNIIYEYIVYAYETVWMVVAASPLLSVFFFQTALTCANDFRVFLETLYNKV